MLSYYNADSIIQTDGRCQVNNGMAYYHNRGKMEGKRKMSATVEFATEPDINEEYETSQKTVFTENQE